MNFNWIVDLYGADGLLQSLAGSVSESLLMLIGFSVVSRIPLVKRELKNFKTWNENLSKLYQRCGFNSRVYIILTVGIFLKITSNSSTRSDGGSPGLLSWFTSYCLVRWSKIDECPAWEAQMLDGMSGLDYSSCMADSYFNGYLSIILPAQETKQKNLRQRIDQFMEEQKITDEEFPVKSLIVLVPKSGRCFPLLSKDPRIPEEEREKITTCKELEDAVIDRAGTKGRVYRIAAYCLDLNPRTEANLGVKHLYAVAEQPTIVQTFQESLEKNMCNAETLREHKTEIIHKFYRNIKKYVYQSTGCHNLAEFVYYDDDEDVASVLRNFLIQKCLENRHKMKRY